MYFNKTYLKLEMICGFRHIFHVNLTLNVWESEQKTLYRQAASLFLEYKHSEQLQQWTTLNGQCKVSWTGMNTPLHTHSSAELFLETQPNRWDRGPYKACCVLSDPVFTPDCWIQHPSASLLTSSPQLKQQGETDPSSSTSALSSSL